jgi:hypothetical protein
MLRSRFHTNNGATLLFTKGNAAFNEGEDCVVFAKANVQAWFVLGATLANDDVARNHSFTTELFDAQTTAR